MTSRLLSRKSRSRSRSLLSKDRLVMIERVPLTNVPKLRHCLPRCAGKFGLGLLRALQFPSKCFTAGCQLHACGLYICQSLKERVRECELTQRSTLVWHLIGGVITYFFCTLKERRNTGCALFCICCPLLEGFTLWL